MADSNWRSILEMARRTQTARGRAAAGLYSVAGSRMVKRALQAGLQLLHVLHSPAFGAGTAEADLLAQLDVAGSPRCVVPAAALQPLTRDRVAGEVLALLPLPAPPHLEQCLQLPAPLLVAAVNIQDPGNLGAMVRTAHAGGATLFLHCGTGDPFHPEAVRTSLGSIFKCPVLGISWKTVLPALAAAGVETVAAVAAAGTPLPHYRFSAQGTAIFMGSEAAGLPARLLAGLPRRVSIPMAAGIDSLSVNAATAIMLYEINRQRSG